MQGKLTNQQWRLGEVFRAEYATNQHQGFGTAGDRERHAVRTAIENIVGSTGDVFAQTDQDFRRPMWYQVCLGRETLRPDEPNRLYKCDSCREGFATSQELLRHPCQGPAEHPGQADYTDPYEGQHASVEAIEAAIAAGERAAQAAVEAAARSGGAKVTASFPVPLGQSVSHGTLNPDHLYPVLLSTFAKVDSKRARDWMLTPGDPDDKQTWVAEIMDILDELAPEGYHFGSIEGDGSDFGFWADNEDDLPNEAETREILLDAYWRSKTLADSGSYTASDELKGIIRDMKQAGIEVPPE